jgi:hypothetical protein
MSTDSVSPLRQRMTEDMNARKLCAGTQRGHIRNCKQLAASLKRSLDTGTSDDIRRFQLRLAESGASIRNRNRIMTGLRPAYRRGDQAEGQHIDSAPKIIRVEQSKSLPPRRRGAARTAMSCCRRRCSICCANGGRRDHRAMMPERRRRNAGYGRFTAAVTRRAALQLQLKVRCRGLER